MTAHFKLTMIVGLLCMPWSTACARDMSSMYETAVLEQWGSRYRASTNKILTEFVYKYLTAEEKRRLAGIPIEFPLMAEGRLKGDPLVFYVPPGHSRVVFPIFSVKFLDDLSTAYAWLQVNNYVIDTISEYTAMLMHKDLGEGFQHHYPRCIYRPMRSGTRKWMSLR